MLGARRYRRQRGRDSRVCVSELVVGSEESIEMYRDGIVRLE